MENYSFFRALMKPITKDLMEECKERFRSDYDCVSFDTFTHLQTMVFAHIAEIKSLRTLEVAINSQEMGLSYPVHRSTVSDANQKRKADCFFWLLKQVMSLLPRKFHQDIGKVVKLLDSSPIQLKGRGFDEWAKEYATSRCQGLKLHVELDLMLNAPTRVTTSHSNYNDSTMGKDWPIITECVYVFDKGYCDYNWWWDINQKSAYFVTRLKKNAAVTVHNDHPTDNETILEDSLVQFKNKRPRGGKVNLYETPLRRIIVKREGKTPLILVSNLLEVPAAIISDLYKARWDVELFFKWIKQNLKLKKFLGRSPNAVKIQIATALIAYVLTYLFKIDSKNKLSLRLITILIRFSVSKTLTDVLHHPPPTYHFSRPSLTYQGDG